MNKIKTIEIGVNSNGVTVSIEGREILRLNKKIRDVEAYDPTQDKMLIELISGVIGTETSMLVLLDSWMEGGAN